MHRRNRHALSQTSHYLRQAAANVALLYTEFEEVDPWQNAPEAADARATHGAHPQ